jgi:hypothetical protein
MHYPYEWPDRKVLWAKDERAALTGQGSQLSHLTVRSFTNHGGRS